MSEFGSASEFQKRVNQRGAFVIENKNLDRIQNRIRNITEDDEYEDYFETPEYKEVA